MALQVLEPMSGMQKTRQYNVLRLFLYGEFHALALVRFFVHVNDRRASFLLPSEACIRRTSNSRATRRLPIGGWL